MTRVRPHIAAAACCAAFLVVCSSAFAEGEKGPDPRFSTVTPVLVGTPGGDAIRLWPPSADGPGFHMHMRSVNNSPVIAGTAILDFSGSPSIRIYTEQQAGVTVDCVNRRMLALSMSGDYTFYPRFGGFDNGRNVYAECNGVVLAAIPARSTDMDGIGGSTGLADLARFEPLFLTGATDHPEADFDGSGGPIGLPDFAIITRSYMEQAVGATCP